MPHLRTPATALRIVVLLTACGGGDGDSGSKGPNLSGNPGGGSGGVFSMPASVLNGMSKFGATPRVTMTLSASGAISFSNWGACSPTGTVSPRSSGRNVFNLSISFKGACPLAEGTLASGVFFVDKSASSAQAYVLAQTANKDDGFFAASAN
jgi:hypothetical protein